MFSLKRAGAFCVFVFSVTVSGLTHAAFSQLVAFGDSLSDTGNIFFETGTPTPPYFDGNFSNGPVWVDQLAGILGVATPTASQAGGPAATNYSWGGARTTLLADGFIPSTQSQVSTYLGDVGGAADPDALYTILTGGNDLNALDFVTYGFAELADDARAVAGIADQLIMAGAQNILVVNVPDLGAAPASDGNEALATLATQVFNAALLVELVSLGSEFVSFLDAFGVSQDIVNNPGAFGLTDVDNSCLTDTGGLGGAVCDTYLFWDDLHPTAAGHELIAMAAAAKVVPVPAAAWLFGSAILGLFGLARRRRA